MNFCGGGVENSQPGGARGGLGMGHGEVVLHVHTLESEGRHLAVPICDQIFHQFSRHGSAAHLRLLRHPGWLAQRLTGVEIV
jgi:hypothetical protein